jgi:predicted patatin/cPLA2 family phospholipase
MFDQMVMAGGGGRCTWQVGFLEVVKPRPRVISTVSAGGLMACLMYAQNNSTTLDYCKKLFGDNQKNIYLENILNKENIFPQYNMYKKMIHDLLADPQIWLKDAPEIRIGVTHAPSWLNAYSSLALGFAAYSFDKKVRKALHPSLAGHLGFQQHFSRVQDCHSTEALADLILKSSCVPPIMPILYTKGRPILDGGIVDNVPIAGLDATPGKILILLSRQYADLTQYFRVDQNNQQRLYVQPSQPIPVKGWDYTRPDLIEETYQMGLKDGERFLNQTNLI